jgi:TNFR/NGFR cysteine-rich region
MAAFIALLLLATLAFATAAPTSTTGGQNANTQICKVLSQKGCKSVGIRGDECCPNSGLFCQLGNGIAPSTCTKCNTCVWGEKTVSDCAPTSQTVCGKCANSANAASYVAPGKTCVVAECKDGFFYKSESEGCVACTTCTDGSNYETTQCSAQSDRVCSTCQSCSSNANFGTYANGGCKTTAAGGKDRICTDCANKNNAQAYEQPGVTCVVAECKPEFFYPNVETGCTACTAACKDGETYQSTQCSTTSDRVCQSCSSCGDGYFQTGTCTVASDTTCQKCTSCGDGFYADGGCAASEDTICKVTPIVTIIQVPEPVPEPVPSTPVCNGGCSECTTCQWSGGVGSAGVCKAADDDKLCSNKAGFCSAGTCKLPVPTCVGITKPGCSTMCGFDINLDGTKGASYNCMLVKTATGNLAAGAAVCRSNEAVCKGGNCFCNANASRRTLF